jgi:hypothetical protein
MARKSGRVEKRARRAVQRANSAMDTDRFITLVVKCEEAKAQLAEVLRAEGRATEADSVLR